MSDKEPIEVALDKLRDAIQEYAVANSEESVMVTEAVVVWEQVRFKDGETGRRVNWCIPTDQFALAAAVGLMDLGRAYLMSDLVKVHVCDGHDED